MELNDVDEEVKERRMRLKNFGDLLLFLLCLYSPYIFGKKDAGLTSCEPVLLKMNKKDFTVEFKSIPKRPAPGDSVVMLVHASNTKKEYALIPKKIKVRSVKKIPSEIKTSTVYEVFFSSSSSQILSTVCTYFHSNRGI